MENALLAPVDLAKCCRLGGSRLKEQTLDWEPGVLALALCDVGQITSPLWASVSSSMQLFS